MARKPLRHRAAVTSARHNTGVDTSIASPRLRPSLPLAGVRVLVMDGSPARRSSARSALEACGAEVAVVPDLAAACVSALAFSPDLVVSSPRFAAGDWHGVLRLLSDGTPAVLMWGDGASPEALADLAVRLYGGGRG